MLSRPRKKKKSNVGQKILYAVTSILGVIVILMSVAYGGFYHYYSKMNIVNTDEYNYEPVSDVDLINEDVSGTDAASDTASDVSQPADQPYGTGNLVYDFSDPDITNIMIVGTDSRKKGLWRTASDAMILVSINKKTQKVFFTSFMRDTRVFIKKGGNHRVAGDDKLNAAYAYGGSKMMFETYEENFGIKFDKYVHFDFYSFITIVDSIGGIDMYIKANEIKYMNDVYLSEINTRLLHRPRKTDYLPRKTGTYHLNGKQALAYTRVRYVGGDTQRTERQRKVIEAILGKVKTMSATKLSKFAERALKCVSTNLGQTDVMSLLMDAPECLQYETISTRIPIDKTSHSQMIKGTYFLVCDLKKNADYWYSLVYLDKDISKEIVQQIEEEKAAQEAEANASSQEQADVSSDAVSSNG